MNWPDRWGTKLSSENMNMRAFLRLHSLGIAFVLCIATMLGACASHAWAGEIDNGDTESASTPAAAVNFSEDILPILAENCYHCHGPDANERQAELRLDTREGAITDNDGVQAVVPGHADQSELFQRITATDADERMPPADSGRSLSAAEIELLRLWIEQGANWQQHWSFVTPIRPSVPGVDNRDRPKNAIDHFVLARLEAEGLASAPQADKTTLIRRVTFDLTGLPPTPAEVDAFLADDSPDAYEKVINRLLASHRYAEQMTMQWLDLARYADTNGYQVDNERYMWRWRDWVIDAFDRNMPFDQFTIEQIAGDLLPNATLEQRIATGFNRNHTTTFEGGVIPEEYRVEYVIDRVNTTAAVWLGLTIGCGRCHDHKYDPISQKEFYGFSAYFNNVPENGLDGAEGNSVPHIKAPTSEQQFQLNAIRSAIAKKTADIEALVAATASQRANWEEQARSEWSQRTGETLSNEPAAIVAELYGAAANMNWTLLDPTRYESTGGARLQKLDDGSLLAEGQNPATETYEVDAQCEETGLTAIRLEAIPHASLPAEGAGRGKNGAFVLTEFEVEAVSLANPKKTRKLQFTAAVADVSNERLDFFEAIDGKTKKDNGWRIDSAGGPQPATIVLAATEPFGFEGGTKLRFRLRHETRRTALGRFRLSVTTDDANRLAPPSGIPPRLFRIVLTEPDTRSEQQQSQLAEYHATTALADGRHLADERATLRQEEKRLYDRVPTTMVMQESAEKREARILIRGQYNRPGEKVEPSVPACFPPLKDAAPPNRLGLAGWLVDPANPLTARVIVNRYWQHYFGFGLVKSVEDFGTRGDRPSHPDLLDWLAAEFVRTGWDIKAMQKLIVTSGTYQQSSKTNDSLRRRDPQNRLLARGPRFRFSAEMIRDHALAASGLLVERLGGPSVKPYQPPGLWKEVSSGGVWSAQKFEQDHANSLYRRSMYTFWKRAVPPPALQTFDAPTREYCAISRSRTNTPLQALVLMNDPTYVEASRALAERLMKEAGPTPASRIELAFRLTLARRPTTVERDVLLEAYRERLREFQNDTEAALMLLDVGESSRDETLNVAELAAWATVSSILLNLDEAITKG